MPNQSRGSHLKLQSLLKLTGPKVFRDLQLFVDDKPDVPQECTEDIMKKLKMLAEQALDSSRRLPEDMEKTQIILQVVQTLCSYEEHKSGVPVLIEHEAFITALHGVREGEDPAEKLYEDVLETLTALADYSVKVKGQLLEKFCDRLLQVVIGSTFKFGIKLETLKTLNVLLERCPVMIREKLNQLSAHKELRNKAGKLVSVAGDYEFQVGITEALFRMTNKNDRPALAKLWFESEDHFNAFLNVRDSDFETDCRKFLNVINSSYGDERSVFSYPCEQVYLGKFELHKPEDNGYAQFWIDFNTESQRISLFCNQQPTESQREDEDDNLWETVSVWHDNIEKYCIKDLAQHQELVIRTRENTRDLINFGPSFSDTSITLKFTNNFDVRLAIEKTCGVGKFGSGKNVKPRFRKVSTPTIPIYVNINESYQETQSALSEQAVTLQTEPEGRPTNLSQEKEKYHHSVKGKYTPRMKVSVPCMPMTTPTRVSTPVVPVELASKLGKTPPSNEKPTASVSRTPSGSSVSSVKRIKTPLKIIRKPAALVNSYSAVEYEDEIGTNRLDDDIQTHQVSSSNNSTKCSIPKDTFNAQHFNHQPITDSGVSTTATSQMMPHKPANLINSQNKHETDTVIPSSCPDEQLLVVPDSQTFPGLIVPDLGKFTMTMTTTVSTAIVNNVENNTVAAIVRTPDPHMLKDLLKAPCISKEQKKEQISALKERLSETDPMYTNYPKTRYKVSNSPALSTVSEASTPISSSISKVGSGSRRSTPRVPQMETISENAERTPKITDRPVISRTIISPDSTSQEPSGWNIKSKTDSKVAAVNVKHTSNAQSLHKDGSGIVENISEEGDMNAKKTYRCKRNQTPEVNIVKNPQENKSTRRNSKQAKKNNVNCVGKENVPAKEIETKIIGSKRSARQKKDTVSKKKKTTPPNVISCQVKGAIHVENDSSSEDPYMFENFTLKNSESQPSCAPVLSSKSNLNTAFDLKNNKSQPPCAPVLSSKSKLNTTFDFKKSESQPSCAPVVSSKSKLNTAFDLKSRESRPSCAPVVSIKSKLNTTLDSGMLKDPFGFADGSQESNINISPSYRSTHLLNVEGVRKTNRISNKKHMESDLSKIQETTSRRCNQAKKTAQVSKIVPKSGFGSQKFLENKYKKIVSEKVRASHSLVIQDEANACNLSRTDAVKPKFFKARARERAKLQLEEETLDKQSGGRSKDTRYIPDYSDEEKMIQDMPLSNSLHTKLGHAKRVSSALQRGTSDKSFEQYDIDAVSTQDLEIPISRSSSRKNQASSRTKKKVQSLPEGSERGIDVSPIRKGDSFIEQSTSKEDSCMSDFSKMCQSLIEQANSRSLERNQRNRKPVSYKEVSESDGDPAEASISDKNSSSGVRSVPNTITDSSKEDCEGMSKRRSIKSKKKKPKSVFSETDDNLSTRSEVSWLGSTARKPKKKAEKTYIYKSRPNLKPNLVSPCMASPLEKSISEDETTDEEQQTADMMRNKFRKKRKLLSPGVTDNENTDLDGLYYEKKRRNLTSNSMSACRGRSGKKNDISRVLKDRTNIFSPGISPERSARTPTHLSHNSQLADRYSNLVQQSHYDMTMEQTPTSRNQDDLESVESLRATQSPEHAPSMFRISPIMPIALDHEYEPYLKDDAMNLDQDRMSELGTQDSTISFISSLRTPKTPKMLDTSQISQDDKQSLASSSLKGMKDTQSSDVDMTYVLKSGPVKKRERSRSRSKSSNRGFEHADTEESLSELSSQDKDQNKMVSHHDELSEHNSFVLQPRCLFEDQNPVLNPYIRRKDGKDSITEEEELPSTDESNTVAMEVGIPHGVASIIQSFGSEIQRTIMARKQQLECLTKETLRATEKEVQSVMTQQQSNRQEIFNAFKDMLLQELLDLEKDQAEMKEAEDKTLIFFKDQVGVITRCRTSQEQRLKNLKKLQITFGNNIDHAEEDNQDQQQSVKDVMRKEMESLQKKILQQSQQHEIMSMRKQLQTMFL